MGDGYVDVCVCVFIPLILLFVCVFPVVNISVALHLSVITALSYYAGATQEGGKHKGFFIIMKYFFFAPPSYIASCFSFERCSDRHMLHSINGVLERETMRWMCLVCPGQA